MSPFLEVLLNTVAGQLTEIGKIKLIEVLQKFHDKNPVEYEACIKAGHAFATPLMIFVAGTRTKLDDGFVDAVDDAVIASAEANNVTLA